MRWPASCSMEKLRSGPPLVCVGARQRHFKAPFARGAAALRDAARRVGCEHDPAFQQHRAESVKPGASPRGHPHRWEPVARFVQAQARTGVGLPQEYQPRAVGRPRRLDYRHGLRYGRVRRLRQIEHPLQRELVAAGKRRRQRDQEVAGERAGFHPGHRCTRRQRGGGGIKLHRLIELRQHMAVVQHPQRQARRLALQHRDRLPQHRLALRGGHRVIARLGEGVAAGGGLLARTVAVIPLPEAARQLVGFQLHGEWRLAFEHAVREIARQAVQPEVFTLVARFAGERVVGHLDLSAVAPVVQGHVGLLRAAEVHAVRHDDPSVRVHRPARPV